MPADQSQPQDLPALLGGEPVRPDGPPAWPVADPAVRDALEQAVANGSWGQYHGPNCEALSKALAEYHGSEHALLCASGTAAVEMALRGLNVGDGDEVILAAYDFKGNFHNVLTVGARPVLIDIDERNWNLNPELLEAALSDRTKAIIVSHLHGGVVPMSRVMEIAQKNGVAVIEDACQMPGARIEGRMAGMCGDVGVLSFGGSKLLSAGRGGALLTNDEQIVQRVRLYSFRGNDAYPLSELQAAVLVPQLEQLDERNRIRTQNVKSLCDGLAKQPGLSPFRNVGCASEPGYYKLGFQYTPEEFAELTRERFAAAMRAEGIALDAGFRSLHCTHSKRRFQHVGDLTNATDADNRVLTLHHPVLLGSSLALEQVVRALDKIRQFATILSKQG